MSYRATETPTGTIDGANTTFTTAYTLYQAVIITVDGVVYTGAVTYSGNSFTLADAPTVSITISYYDTASSTAVTGTLTPETLQTQYGYFKQDITDVDDNTFIQWCDWINKFAYRHIKGIDPERFIEETTINAVGGQEWAYLPTDFRDTTEFGCGLWDYDSAKRSSLSYPITNPNDQTRGYYVKNDRIYFTPTPADSHAYMLRYTPNEPTIDALDDTFIAPLDSRYTQYLVAALDVLYEQWDNNIPSEGVADSRFVRLLDELSRNVKQQPAVYGLDDPTIYF